MSELATTFGTAFVRLSELTDTSIDAADLPAVQAIVGWVREFLSHPHASLGRDGDVCPYTRPSIDAGLLHLAVWREAGPDVAQELTAAMRAARRFWERLAPTSGPQVLFKAVLVVLPGLAERTAVIDAVQRELSLEFTRDGLMIGEFYATCAVGGLHNPEFRPMQAPAPMLAIRKMVLADLPFMLGADAKLDNYFRHFGEAARRMAERYLQRAPGLAPDIARRLRRRLSPP